jgi:hypothetical protein
MKQYEAGDVALRIVEGVLATVGWALTALGGVLNATVSGDHQRTPPTPTEIDQDGHVVKEGTTDFP